MADSSARLIAYQRRATIPVFIATLCVVPVLIFEGSSNSLRLTWLDALAREREAVDESRPTTAPQPTER